MPRHGQTSATVKEDHCSVAIGFDYNEGNSIRSAGGGENAALPTISAFSSKKVGVFSSGSVSADVLDDIHGLVYRNAVQHRSLSPTTPSDPGRKDSQLCFVARLMV